MGEIIRSALKLQSLDDTSGLYEWKKKLFTLDITASMLTSMNADGAAKETGWESSSHAQKGAEFTISGAVHAKEWTLSSPIAGYGFDLVWASGWMYH